jgi:hypothetical protein
MCAKVMHSPMSVENETPCSPQSALCAVCGGQGVFLHSVSDYISNAIPNMEYLKASSNHDQQHHPSSPLSGPDPDTIAIDTKKSATSLTHHLHTEYNQDHQVHLVAPTAALIRSTNFPGFHSQKNVSSTWHQGASTVPFSTKLSSFINDTQISELSNFVSGTDISPDNEASISSSSLPAKIASHLAVDGDGKKSSNGPRDLVISQPQSLMGDTNDPWISQVFKFGDNYDAELFPPMSTDVLVLPETNQEPLYSLSVPGIGKSTRNTTVYRGSTVSLGLETHIISLEERSLSDIHFDDIDFHDFCTSSLSNGDMGSMANTLPNVAPSTASDWPDENVGISDMTGGSITTGPVVWAATHILSASVISAAMRRNTAAPLMTARCRIVPAKECSPFIAKTNS